MGVITITKLKCDKCGLEVNCAGFSPDEAKSIMRKRGWVTPGKGVICPDCKTPFPVNKDKDKERK